MIKNNKKNNTNYIFIPTTPDQFPWLFYLQKGENPQKESWEIPEKGNN